MRRLVRSRASVVGESGGPVEVVDAQGRPRQDRRQREGDRLAFSEVRAGASRQETGTRDVERPNLGDVLCSGFDCGRMRDGNGWHMMLK